MSSNQEGVVTFREGDNVDIVLEGTTKLIFDNSIKNVPQGDKDEERSPFPGRESIKEIDIKRGVQSIGDYSFSKCKKLEKINFRWTEIKHIKKGAFYKCENLTTLIIPASVNWIEEAAFGYCTKLIGVTFLSKSTKIHKEAFAGCDALPYFMYKNNIQASTETTEDQATEISDKLIITENVEEGQYEKNDTIRVVEVNEGVERIGWGAFGYCTSLESIQLPKSLQDIDKCVFNGCASLREINIPENVTVISGGLFYSCTSLKKVKLSSYTTLIDYEAFSNCTSLKNINLPQTLEVIGYEAFQNCISLRGIETSLTIPRSVRKIGTNAFRGCTSLREVTILPQSLQEIGEGVFEGCTSLQEIYIYANVTVISGFLFSGCTSLEYVTLSPSTTKIGYRAFENCIKLRNIELPQTLELIEHEAFKNCISLRGIETSLTIPRSVRKIGTNAFRGCTSLREVTIQNPDIEIGEGAFAGCIDLGNIKGLPSSEKNIKSYLERKVFEGCLSLENVIGNEIHLAAEGKCWKGVEFPQDGHLWIQQALEGKNKERENALEKANSKTSESGSSSNEVEPQDASSSSPSQVNLKDDASFQKDYKGNTAFECAVRGGAPLSYLKVLAQGFDENGKTHFDIFVEENARKKPDYFTADELTFFIEQNSKHLAATPIGKGRNYVHNFEQLLNSTIIYPRTEPEFIHILNNLFKSKRFAIVLMLEIIIPFLRIISFFSISDVYFDEEDEEKEGHANVGWFVSMYFTILYLIFREFLQIRQGFLAYLTDPWNWYDFVIIITSTIATIMMHTTDYVVEKDENGIIMKEKYYWMKSFVIFTTFLIWFFAILKTKVLSVNLAKFVTGIINVVWTLIPFILVSFLMLGAFAHMYYINDRSAEYKDFWTSMQWTYSSLLSFGLPHYSNVGVFFESANKTVVLDEEDSMNKIEMCISMFFGFIVVILLSNILIAVLSIAWGDISERGSDEFLRYRVRLLLETAIVFTFFETKVKKDHSITSKTSFWSLSPDANYNKMWGESEKFSEVLIRMNPVLFGRIVLNIIYTVLGIFFGLTWPTAVREALLCIDNSEAIADKRNRLQTRLRETKREVERLSKIDKHITLSPNHLYLKLSECDGILSHFQLKKKILLLEKQVKKQKNDVENFKNWEEKLKGGQKEKND